MKIFILFSLFLTSSLFAFHLFGGTPNLSIEQSSIKYNKELISVNKKRSQVMRKFIKCMQKAHTNNEFKSCNSNKEHSLQFMNSKQRKIYFDLRKAEFEKSRNVINNYNKNNSIVINPKKKVSFFW